MNEDIKFARLENRVEKLDDKIDIIKEDISELRADLKIFSDKIERHVAGDEKIISELVPVMSQFKLFLENDLPSMKEIISLKKAEEIMEKESIKKKNKLKLNLSILATIVGLVYTLVKLDIIKL